MQCLSYGYCYLTVDSKFLIILKNLSAFSNVLKACYCMEKEKGSLIDPCKHTAVSRECPAHGLLNAKILQPISSVDKKSNIQSTILHLKRQTN